ncbi:STAS domain-containing protein [Amycolatopsis sp. SID8362]|uniref:STAS domain-containing protein n=1 Tax=Amycolatopsis sp. SID8362 TaxID=2690346 RepID=UPI00136EA3B6|nr:STAS domain-containing protein [Amycolatopsis sp. SID8362]NBH05131.1 anti-sigma factor antagonist [Amycolatopsis sp. SID8362]NED41831.1 STAS domain-containing protein [Amycolatopsis sp. SID8362]
MTSSSRDLPAIELAVTLDWRGRAAVLGVAGEIDLLSAPEFEDVVAAVLADGPETLVVDLRSVTFFCSAGLQVLASAHRKMTEHALRVVSDSPVTSGPLKTTGLDTWISVHPTVDEALT